MHRRRTLGWGALLCTAHTIAVSPALSAPIDTASLIRRTCLGATASQPGVERRRLATFILSDQGIISDDPSVAPEARLLHILDGSDVGANPGIRTGLRNVVYRLQEQLGGGGGQDPAELGLEVIPRDPSRHDWWLISDNYQLMCRFRPTRSSHAQPGGAGGTGHSDGSLLSLFRLRQNLDALSATDAARLKAGAAQIGYLRERNTLANGSIRTDSTLTFEGALGLALRDRPDSALLLYGAYERRRLRSNPPPQLPPGQSQADKDTDVLELGFTGHQLVSMPGVSVMLTGSGSYISNYVNDSRRLRLRVSAAPFLFWPNGICYFGGFAPPVDLGFARLSGRCTASLIAQVNHITDRGSTTPGANDEFVLAGGRIGYDIATGTDSGVIAGVTYEYQHRFEGQVPSIHRFTAQIKYRHWFSDRRFAMEFGFNYTDGVNPQSFADEHRTQVGMGLIF